MKKIFWIFCALLLASAGFLGGCKKESKSDNTALLAVLALTGSSTYGGTTPIGDLIEVNIDRLGKKVTHVNYTTNVASGPFSYAAVPAATANGFSILNKAIVNANNDYVLFSEFPGVALVYQMFNSNGTASGWPVYVVIKASPSAADYYG